MDDTLLQFGRGTAGAPLARPSARVEATVCPRCANHFSKDGAFCPFDGEPLLPSSARDPDLDGLIGSVIDGRYEVLSILGEGGMGVVYESRHRALGKRFALKALRKDLASDAETALRFMQEARTAASLSHPGLVEITDFGRLPSGQPFFVMELLEGQALSTMIRWGGPIPAARAVLIIRQIAEALSAAHERSIMHRDLKPDNIHISPAEGGGDRVTIVDFGLAKVIGASRLTRAGMVFGTPHYMSPEQATGEATDHRADIYALGVVMYEMFTGRVPFEADSYMGVLTKHMYMAPTPPSRLPGTAQLGALETILLRCLEKKAEHRYGTLRELIFELDSALASAGEPLASAARQRAVPRSLLADELELPSHDELGLGLERKRPKALPWGLFSVLTAALLVAGIGGVLALRARNRAGVPRSASSASSALAHTADTAGVPPLPAISALAPPAATPAPSRTRPAPAAAPASATALPRKGTRPKGEVLPSSAAVGGTRTALPVGRSEIVDPWANGSKGDRR